jgi:hypothetical protein
MRMGAESPVLSFLGFARSTLDARIYSFTARDYQIASNLARVAGLDVRGAQSNAA